MLLQTEFYLKFKKANPNAIIGEWTVQGFKPFFMKPIKEKNTC